MTSPYKYIVVLFCLLCLGEYSTAQGHLGKRFILKTDPLAWLTQGGIIVDLDYVIARNLSGSIFMSTSNEKYTQRLTNYQQRYGFYPQKKGTIQDMQFGGKLKLYVGDSPPAPIGVYFYSSYAQGRAQATGDYFNNRTSELIPYQIENIKSQQISLGLGNEYIIKDFISIDFDFALTYGFLSLPENVPELEATAFQSFSGRYGPNIYSGELENGNGLGLTAHIKIGFLLF